MEGSATLQRWTTAALPVRAACLEVTLRRPPQLKGTFALGIDEPLSLSVHSAVARLAPEVGALIHVAKYLPAASRSDARGDERQLEELLDLIQPGWRDVVVDRRFLPRRTVSAALAMAVWGGLGGRPAEHVPELRNLYIAGDWVGSRGMLADASLASARAAARMIVGRQAATLAA